MRRDVGVSDCGRLGGVVVLVLLGWRQAGPESECLQSRE